MDSDWIFAIAGVGWVCWTIGGAGAKWVRRYLWPGILATVALLYGITLWRCLLTLTLSAIAHSLGYSPQKYNILVRAVIGSTYGFALIPITNLWIAPVITSVVFVSMMQLSLKYNWFTWKIVEGLNGLVQGLIVAWCIL